MNAPQYNPNFPGTGTGFPPGQPQYPQPPYAPQYQQPQYQPPTQQYPQQPQPPQQELMAGSLDAYFSQPSTGGGAALKFATVGTTHTVIVSRPITDADVQQQTQRGTNQPATFRDGRPKFVLRVPCLIQPSQDHPDGQAQWWCAGAARDELTRAMAEGGAPAGPPEAGATIQVTKTGERPSGAGMNPAAVYSVRYWRPEGGAVRNGGGGNTQSAALPESIPLPTPPPVAPPIAPHMPPPLDIHPPVPGVIPPVSDPPGGLSPEQQALLARLTSQVSG